MGLTSELNQSECLVPFFFLSLEFVFDRDGQAQRSADVLQLVLSSNFEVIKEDSMPVLIANHSRKFELLVTHRLVVRKK